MGADVTFFGTGGVARSNGPNSVTVELGNDGAALVELPQRAVAAVSVTPDRQGSRPFGIYPALEEIPSPPQSEFGFFFTSQDDNTYLAKGVRGYYESGVFLPYHTVWTERSADGALYGTPGDIVDAVYVYGKPSAVFVVTWRGDNE